MSDDDGALPHQVLDGEKRSPASEPDCWSTAGRLRQDFSRRRNGGKPQSRVQRNAERYRVAADPGMSKAGPLTAAIGHADAKANRQPRVPPSRWSNGGSHSRAGKAPTTRPTHPRRWRRSTPGWAWARTWRCTTTRWPRPWTRPRPAGWWWRLSCCWRCSTKAGTGEGAES